MSRSLHILVDSREKRPWVFRGYKTTVCALDGYDYTVRGLRKRLGVERKSLVDLASRLSTSKNFSEFMRLQIAKLAKIPRRCIIVEGDLQNITLIKRKLGPKTIHMGNIINRLSIIQSYRIPVWFCSTVEMANSACLDFLRTCWQREYSL